MYQGTNMKNIIRIWNVRWRLSNCLTGFTHPRRNSPLLKKTAQLEREDSLPPPVCFWWATKGDTNAQLSPPNTDCETKTRGNKYSKSHQAPSV